MKMWQFLTTYAVIAFISIAASIGITLFVVWAAVRIVKAVW